MPSINYQSAAEVAQAYQIHFQRLPLVGAVAIAFSDAFLAELTFTLRETPFTHSEFAISETLIYPVLREAWRHYVDSLTLWGHQPITYD